MTRQISEAEIEKMIREAGVGAQFMDPSVPDIGPYGTATNRGRPATTYPTTGEPMGGLFGPAFPGVTNPAIPDYKSPAAPSSPSDNPIRDAIVRQLLQQANEGSGPSPDGYGPDFGDPATTDAPAVAAPHRSSRLRR